MELSSNFKVNSNIITNLGEELIKNELVAVVEMIKNSYDADSTKVIINFMDIENKEKGYIEIIDDGLGMNQSDIINNWLNIGISDKKNQLRTIKYKRYPLGEKGIGRFSAHKLGSRIEIFSKKEFNDEIYTSIDWNDFSSDRYLSEVPIRIQNRDSNLFSGVKHGTIIKISNLKKEWTMASFLDLYENLQSIYSNSTNENFKLEINNNNEDWQFSLENLRRDYTFESLFSITAEVEGSKINSLQYSFKPYSVLNSLSPRTEKIDNVELKDSKNNLIDLSKFKIGKFKIQLEIYDLDSNLLKLTEFKKDILKTYLKMNGGIKLYRDNIKINEYGDSDNDWLSLDMRRVNQPAKRLSNNIVVGSIFLDAETSKDLKEKTNREGFIENEAFVEFKKAILNVIAVVENYRNIDKELLRYLFKKERKKESLYRNLIFLRSMVQETSLPNVEKRAIFSEINKIESDIENKSSILLKSANIGLGVAVAVHEIEKISIEIKREIKILDNCSDVLKSLVDNLIYIINSYRDLLKESSLKRVNLKKLVEDVCRIITYRFKDHNITLEKHFSDSESIVSLSPNLMLGSILNILDNAIWWLDNQNIENKKIFIKVETNDKNHSILIADNGNGFTLEPSLAVQPFVTHKPDGIGLGLYIVYEVLEMHKGILTFPTFQEENLSEEFSKGAIIKLNFPIL